MPPARVAVLLQLPGPSVPGATLVGPRAHVPRGAAASRGEDWSRTAWADAAESWSLPGRGLPEPLTFNLQPPQAPVNLYQTPQGGTGLCKCDPGGALASQRSLPNTGRAGPASRANSSQKTRFALLAAPFNVAFYLKSSKQKRNYIYLLFLLNILMVCSV